MRENIFVCERKMEMTALTIGKVAEAAGVGVETVRFYERKGLIAQPRKPEHGFRVYPDDAIRRIRFIRQAQELGFALRETEDLLALRTDPGSDCADVRVRAVAKLEDVERKLQQLQDIGGALKQVIAACPGRGALSGCSIIEAMANPKERGARNAAISS